MAPAPKTPVNNPDLETGGGKKTEMQKMMEMLKRRQQIEESKAQKRKGSKFVQSKPQADQDNQASAIKKSPSKRGRVSTKNAVSKFKFKRQVTESSQEENPKESDYLMPIAKPKSPSRRKRSKQKNLGD